MREKNIKETFKTLGLKAVLKYLDSNPDENIPKIIDWIGKTDKEGTVTKELRVIREVMSDHDNNWFKLAKSLWSDVDDGVRKKLFENFVINAAVIGMSREKAAKAENECNIPWAILFDPTSACNLHCKGCWAAEYGNGMNLSLETWDSIIEQGKKLGTFMYIYSGGEPMVRRDDIIKMCKKHDDCVFLAFTNATLIDESFADEMLEVKNFLPAISVEGFEEETDYRRGAGTYAKVVKGYGDPS